MLIDGNDDDEDDDDDSDVYDNDDDIMKDVVSFAMTIFFHNEIALAENNVIENILINL